MKTSKKAVRINVTLTKIYASKVPDASITTTPCRAIVLELYTKENTVIFIVSKTEDDFWKES